MASDEHKKIAETANQRAGLTVIGPTATDDQVQDAADAADGKLDGDIRRQPDTDAEQALEQYHRDGDKMALAFCFGRAVFTRGERHVESDDWAALAVELGPAAILIIRALARVLA